MHPPPSVPVERTRSAANVFNIRSQLLEFARFKSAVMTDDKTRNDDPFGVYFETNNPDRCGVGNMVWFEFEEVSRYGPTDYKIVAQINITAK